MKILVTGGAGFIGSHVADALLDLGHDVHVMDNFAAGKRENVPPGATLHELDIRSKDAAAVCAAERFEILFHLAAQMDVRRSVADPGYDADVNIVGFLSLVEGARSSLKKIVFASTGGAIYGEPDYTPQDEQHPARPLSPYGITKLATEKYLFFYKQTYGVDYVALRYGNVFGPRQNPHGEAGVVAIFTERMLRSEPVWINGSGRQTRDYVFVGDVVRANMAALSYSGSGIFNVGTGIETDVNYLFRAIRSLTNADVEEQHADAKPGEQMRSVLGCDHALNELGWKPLFGVDEGLKNTVEWFAEKFDEIRA
ncbi:MAG: NAD-dependent epimerase/dehydratase family protein [Rhodothermales bacterium]